MAGRDLAKLEAVRQDLPQAQAGRFSDGALPGYLFFLPGLFVLLAILCSSRICEIFNGMMEVDIVCFSWMLSRVSTRQTVFVAFFNRKSHVLHVLRLATLIFWALLAPEEELQHMLWPPATMA